MPGDKFKPQYKRLIFIDRKLREGKFPSCASLGAEWEVSAKTIQRDIDYLKYEMNAPIEYNKARHGLYYSDKTWFLPSVLLSEGDILALLVGTQALEMFKGTPVAKELKSIYARLADLLPGRVSIPPELIQCRLTFSGLPARPISAEVWKGLIRGVLHQRVATIEYDSPRSDKPKLHKVHPLHMANLEGEWYLLAFETRWGDIAQFAVSRILKVTLEETVFTPPSDFNAGKMLENRFGKFIHTGDTGKCVPVRILFSPQIADYIAGRTWHPRQKLTWKKGGSLLLELPVVDISDIVPWILGCGMHILKLEPKSLRQAVASAVSKLARLG